MWKFGKGECGLGIKLLWATTKGRKLTEIGKAIVIGRDRFGVLDCLEILPSENFKIESWTVLKR